MKHNNYEAPYVVINTLQNADVLTSSKEFGVDWGDTGWSSTTNEGFSGN